MNAMELARVAKRERPNLRVIIRSGFYDRDELPKGANFLSKPWSAFDLVSKIERAAADLPRKSMVSAGSDHVWYLCLGLMSSIKAKQV
jgi:YesN/AraC family two-component response regulator